MDSIIRIIARLEAIDASSGPINKVGGAFSRLSGIVKGAAAAMLAFGGSKSAYGWTVGAAAQLEMMQLGLSAVMASNSKLDNSISKGLNPMEQMQKKFEITGQMSEQMTEKLQRASIFGIGTLEDYMRSALIIMPQLQNAMGKDFFSAGGMDKAVEMVNSLQMASSVLLAGRGDSLQQYQLGARQLADMLAGTATRRQDMFTGLFPEFAGNVKAFNELSAGERFEKIQQRMMSFNFLSSEIQGKWKNIASAGAEFVQYFGRNLGKPIMDTLVGLVRQIPLFNQLLSQNKAVADAAWQKVKDTATDWGNKVSDGIKSAFNIAKSIAANWQKIADTLKIAAVLWAANAALGAFGALRLGIASAVKLPLVQALVQGAQKAAPIFAANTAKLIGMGSGVGLKFQRFGTPLAVAAGGMGRFAKGMWNWDLTKNLPALSGAQTGKAVDALARLSAMIGRFATTVARVAGALQGFAVVSIIVGVIRGFFNAFKDPNVLMSFNRLQDAISRLRAIFGETSTTGNFLRAVFEWLLKVLDSLAWFTSVVVVSAISGVIDIFTGLVSTANLVVLAIDWVIAGFHRMIASIAGSVAGFVKDRFGAIPGVGKWADGVVSKSDKDFYTAAAQQKAAADKMGRIWNTPIFNNRGVGWQSRLPQPSKTPATGAPTGGLSNAHLGNEDKDGKKKKHPKNVQIFNRGAIQIEIKNMNNYPPDRIAYDMKKVLLEKTLYKTQGTSNGFSGRMPGFGGLA